MLIKIGYNIKEGTAFPVTDKKPYVFSSIKLTASSRSRLENLTFYPAYCTTVTRGMVFIKRKQPKVKKGNVICPICEEKGDCVHRAVYEIPS